MQRRQFLRSMSAAAALPALCSAGTLFAAPESSPRFLLVFLRGGYDCANMLVPYSSDFYYESRPHIAIPRPDAAAPTGALALDSEWALAPALRASIGPLYASKQAAFVPFCGTADLSRSHFETQDNIERGQSDNVTHAIHSGFLARVSTTLTKGAPIAFTDALPLCFQGGRDVPNISLRNVGAPTFDKRQSELLSSMYRDHPLQPAVTEGLELRHEVAEQFDTEMQKANRGAINARSFSAEAGRIATLMRERYRLGFVDVGGWDTHVNEGGAQGQLASNLENLGAGIAAFAQGMQAEWKNTVVVVVSEFGRTFRENGNKGTDHGHGSVYWVLGGGIDGGRIAGEQVKVAASGLLQNRDFPVLTNYRSMLGGLFSRMWGMTPAQLQAIFPDAQTANLRLI